MQTINTKCLGPTNTKGVRIKATTSEGYSVIFSRNYAVDVESDYMSAAKKLMDKMEWTGTMTGGHTKDGMVFVFGGRYDISN